MADDLSGASPKNDPPHVEVEPIEDAETRAARRELKQSSISDPLVPIVDPTVAPSTDEKTSRPDTPANDTVDSQDEETLRRQVASPKKKRAHDQLDGDKAAEDADAQSVASTDSNKDRALRREPEKKRVRDGDSPGDVSNTPVEPLSETEKVPAKKPVPETSTTAFSASGFAKLATESSPFNSFGGAQPSIFASSGTSSLSPFGSTSAATTSKSALPSTAAPKLTFGSVDGASPFAGLSTANGFGRAGTGGSAFGNPFTAGNGSQAFGSPLSGARGPQAFGAARGGFLKSNKPAKPFGAPESESEDEVEDDEGDENAEPAETLRSISPEKDTDEKKKLKLHKVEVDDGEAGEVTLVSVRAKMFHHDKDAGWKERGAGMLKINAPVSCVEFDDADLPIPGSFTASGLDLTDEATDEGDCTTGRKVVRLIMRQDQTHRIILNTAVLPTMKFQEKASLKSVGILFTAFEGEEAKPVSVTMKMSAANAKSFLNEIGSIQGELQTNKTS